MIIEVSNMHSMEFILLLAFHIQAVLTLTCYWCSGVDNDRMCETSPRQVASYPVAINCSTKFCVSTKVMDAVTGNVRSFARSCDHIPRGNQCVKDFHFITCYETCTFDLCNNGNLDPLFLPTRSHSGVLLQPSEVFRVEDTTPKIFNNKKFYKQLSENSEGSKYGLFVNKNLNFDNYLTKLEHKRGKSWKEASADFKSTPDDQLNGFNSFENSEISNYSPKKSLGLTDKGGSSRNDSFIQSYPYFNVAEKGKNPMFPNSDEKVHVFSNPEIPMQDIFWWEKPKDTQADAVAIIQTKRRNNIYENYKNGIPGEDNLNYEDAKIVSVLHMGDKHRDLKSDNNLNDYFPLILKNGSSVVTSMTLSDIAQHEKPSKNRAVFVNYASPVPGITQSSLVRWWEKSEPPPENDQAGDLTVHHPWELPANGLEQVTSSTEPARSGDSHLGDSSDQFVKPLSGSRQTELTRDGSQGFMSVSESAKSEIDKRTNWQETLTGSNNFAHGQGRANNAFFNDPEQDAERGRAVIQQSEPFRANLGNLCRPITCLDVEPGNHTSFNFTANYGFSTSYTQLLNLLNTSTTSPRETEFTTDSALNLKNGLAHVSSKSKVNNSLLDVDTSGQDISPASHYLEFTVVKDGVTGRPASAFDETVSSSQDGHSNPKVVIQSPASHYLEFTVVKDGVTGIPASAFDETVSTFQDGHSKPKVVIQSPFPDPAGINSVATAEKFPGVSDVIDTSDSQSPLERPQINRNDAVPTQQPQRHLKASPRSVVSAERAHLQEEHANTINLSISQQPASETNQGMATADTREDEDSLNKRNSRDPDVSIKRTNVPEDHETSAHLSIKQQQPTETHQDTAPAEEIEGGNRVHIESSTNYPDAQISRKNEKQAKTAHLAITEQIFPGRSHHKEPAVKTEDRNNLHNQSVLDSDVRLTPAHFHKHDNKTKYFSPSHQVSANGRQDVELSGKIEHQNRSDNEPLFHVGVRSKSTLPQEEDSRTMHFSVNDANSTEGIQEVKNSMKTVDERGFDNSGNKYNFNKLMFSKLRDDKHDRDNFSLENSSNDKFNDAKLSYDKASHEKAINDKDIPSYDKASVEQARIDKYNTIYDKASHEKAINDKHSDVNASYDKSKYLENEQPSYLESTSDKSSNLKHDYEEPGIDMHNFKTQNYGNLSHYQFNNSNFNDDKSRNNEPKYNDTQAVINQKGRQLNNVSRSSEDLLYDVRDMSDVKKNANATMVGQENIQKQLKTNLSQIRIETRGEAEKFTNRSKNIDLWISNFTTSDHASSKVQSRIVANAEKTGNQMDASTNETGQEIDVSQVDINNTINRSRARESDTRRSKTDKHESDFSSVHSMTTRWDRKTQTMISTVEVESTVNRSTVVKERVSENTIRERVHTDDGLLERTNKQSHNTMEEGNEESKALKPATRSQKKTSGKQKLNLTDVIPESFIEGKLDNEADTTSVENKRVVGFIKKKQFTKQRLLSEKQHPREPYEQKSSRLHESTKILDSRAGGKRTIPIYKKNRGNDKNVHERKKAKILQKHRENNVQESTNTHRNATTSTGSVYNTATNNMAAKNQSNRSQSRIPRQRIYLRRNVHTPGRNEKLQSESKILILKNSTSNKFWIPSVFWIACLLVFSISSN